jgi:hypothetical protein
MQRASGASESSVNPTFDVAVAGGAHEVEKANRNMMIISLSPKRKDLASDGSVWIFFKLVHSYKKGI